MSNNYPFHSFANVFEMVRQKICNVSIFAITIFCWSHSAYSFDTTAKSAIVYDETTQSVILEKEADKPRPPASMSKLMTLLLAFEALEEGRIDLDTTFRVSAKAFKKGGSKMFLEENQLVSVEDLIRGITVASGNDACIALAEGLNGTEDSFVARMNLKAKDLGLKNSHFTNSTGWPSPGHVMSVRDLLNLSIYIREEYPKYYEYFQEKEYTWNGIKQSNRNPLLKMDIGADGLKTGHTEAAGYGLVGSSNLGNRRISFVLTGLKSSKDRRFESEKIIKWAFRDFTVIDLFSENHVFGKAPVWIGEENHVNLITPKKIRILVPYGGKNTVQAEVEVEIPVRTPIRINDQIGILRIKAPSFLPGSAERTIEYPLLSPSNIGAGGFTKKIQATIRTGLLNTLRFVKLNDIFN